METSDVFTELACSECSTVYAAYRPSREAIERPLCPRCKEKPMAPEGSQTQKTGKGEGDA